MTPRDRRALRLGLGAVICGVLVLRVIPAVMHRWNDARRELAERRALLSEGESLLTGVDGLERSSAATRQRLLSMAPRLLSGTTEAEALADLNGRLALLGNRTRTRLIRADQVADTGHIARLRRVRLRVQVESDWSGLVGFFRAAVADPVTLRIAALSIQSNEGAWGGGPEILQGEVEVSGWYLADTREKRTQ